MNRKVFVSMLSLCVVFLLGLYVAKIFFPNEFAFALSNERMIAFGDFVDNNWIAYNVLTFFTSFVTYFLYLCATCEKKHLSAIECAIVAGTIVVTFVVNAFDVNLAMHLNIASMLILPWAFGGTIGNVAVVYSVHGLAQILSLGIRNLPLLMVKVNFITLFCCNLETYIWLVLFYILSNYYKKENDYGCFVSSLLRKIHLLRKEESKGAEANREVSSED